jgi:hypothetical protein
MELLESIRLKTGNYILLNKFSRIKRKVFYSNINQIKSIGIVWDSSNPHEFIHLSKFYQKMHERKIDVKIIGYFPGKNLPDQYVGIRYLTTIRKQEVNLFYIPTSAETNNFINEKFDILIEINFKKVFPLHYISYLSMAGFKVGLFESGDVPSPFELMMDIKKPADVGNYLDEVLHYLEMINCEDRNKTDK